MIHFDWLWALTVLPLPILVRWLAPGVGSRVATLRTPYVEDFEKLEAEPLTHSLLSRRLLLASLAWLALVGAATRPQWLGEPVALPIVGRDLMLAVDLSESMLEEDFKIGGRTLNRLEATKVVASDFIGRRTGDRLGLILFGDQAYLQVPLTFDRETVADLLDEAVIGLAGKATAIGDAIGLAVKRYREIENSAKVLILMTDGANTAGTIEPVRAAELAAKAGLTIYTIGIGADEKITRTLFGTRKVNPSLQLDEKMLREIAEKTAGRYYRARNVKELDDIYKTLDELEPVSQEPQYYRPRSSLFAWPLAAALLFSALVLLDSVRPTFAPRRQT